MPTEDMALVVEYAANGCERAFEALVSKHVNLVYSVALRQVNEPHLAEEITQAVFVILARKARKLTTTTIVSAWLARTARHVAANTLTIKRRRERREQEAYMQSLDTTSHTRDWAQIAPLLDAAIGALPGKDQSALVLRFFEGQSFSSVAIALGTTEEAAKKRVHRAVGKLRSFFSRYGVTISSAAIITALSANSVQAAPLALASSVTAAAIAGNVASSTSVLINTTIKLMAWTKVKMAAVAGVVLLLGVGTTTMALRSEKAVKTGTPGSSAARGQPSLDNSSPQGTLDSMLRMAAKGDLDAYAENLTPAEANQWRRRMLGKTDGQIKQGMAEFAQAMKNYQVTQTDNISETEVHLTIRPGKAPPGREIRDQLVSFKKVDGGWRFDGDAH